MKHSWSMGLGDTKLVEIRKLRLSGGNNNLTLTPEVNINVVNPGDVQATALIKTKMEFTVDYPNGIDFNLLWGKVTYKKEDPNMTSINFNAFGDILKDNNVSIYNPAITLTTTGNLGVPVKLDLNSIGAINSSTQVTNYVTNANFRMTPSTSPDEMKENVFVLDRNNGTAGLINIKPDQILLGYKIQTDTIIPTDVINNSFISKNSQLSMSYKMEIPLQFGGDLNINLGTTLENPFADKLDVLENQDSLSVSLLLNIKNHIPLTLQIGLEALDADSAALFMVQTDPIEAAGINTLTGFSTEYTETETEISLTTEQINQIKNTKMFRVSFAITAKQGADFVTIQPSDYITIKIGGKINGGVLLDLSSNSKKNQQAK